MRYGYFLSGRPPAEVAIIEFIWTADIWRRLAIGEISDLRSIPIVVRAYGDAFEFACSRAGVTTL